MQPKTKGFDRTGNGCLKNTHTPSAGISRIRFIGLGFEGILSAAVSNGTPVSNANMHLMFAYWQGKM
jgi:hypothetical protein